MTAGGVIHWFVVIRHAFAICQPAALSVREGGADSGVADLAVRTAALLCHYLLIYPSLTRLQHRVFKRLRRSSSAST